ncbi:hypothetical protein VCR3J2_230095 [Vibrio coralliirubri]|uniref:hypothetical protein n=1 Tax=Vibrio coralliirubri TaxID=1516159 RepID=UPI000633BA5E|nr:hypothetical protein [Vibrio coralliirubri]CDT79947.1 hypothetical protein VCR3J2_230095 [Vibrio coralliirubri]CDT83126.1 hypothetical protein VCR12J2_1060087 [Vibrio coralliirubri]
MHYLQKLLSTFVSINYCSGSSDYLDDHLYPNYLQLTEEGQPTHIDIGDSSEESLSRHQSYTHAPTKPFDAEMNNSYSSN